jgi:hypothetical protein
VVSVNWRVYEPSGGAQSPTAKEFHDLPRTSRGEVRACMVAVAKQKDPPPPSCMSQGPVRCFTVHSESSEMIYVLWAELDDDLFVLLHIACGPALCPQRRGGPYELAQSRLHDVAT